jgi:predicted nuclease of restriction endonuclease-like (RecB) superfamily
MHEFSDMKGFSYTNINYMLKFAKTYDNLLIFPQAVGKSGNQIFYADYTKFILEIPWGHNREILDKVDNLEQSLWYAEQTIENGWSRNVLTHQIKSDLYSRQAKAIKINNFQETLPRQNSELAADLIKEEYNFDFLSGDFKERQLEDGLIDNVVKFLLELGKGFAFVGKQYHLEVGGDDFYVDLLLYNIKLKSYVVIELKTGKFKPEYTGKIAFYLSVIDGQLQDKSDNDSIGMILCTDKNNKVASESVKYITKPVGVSQYEISKEIKGKMEEILPSNAELTAQLKL